MVITKSFNLDINTPWKAPTLYIKQGDADSRKLQATIRRDGVNYTIPGDVAASFRMKKPDGTIVTQDCTISGSVISVVMDAQCATAAGHGRAEFILQTASEVVSTFDLAIEILPAAVTDGDIESHDALGEYRTILEEMLRVKGAPLTANTAADMTDTDRVYVYTGSEVGYVNGDWYYYDGASWVVGGTYNSQAISDAFRDEIADMVKQTAVATESDSTPYLYRPTPNPSAILADEEIVGGTIAFNQLCNSASVTVPNGHKYYLRKAGASTITASTGAAVTGLDDGTDMVIDLTAMLGSTIADYLNTLESGTAGAGVAKLREWGFLSKPYFAYDAGSLKSVNTEGKRVSGKNLFNFATATAQRYINTLGNPSVSPGWSVSDYIPIIEDETYTLSGVTNTGTVAKHAFYDDNKTFISYINSTVNPFTVPTGARYVRVSMKAETPTAVQLEIGSSATVFTPYRQPTTYPTTPTDLNGIFYLDENNQLRTKGDVYHADGTIDRNYEVVDLGTCTWVTSSTENVFYTSSVQKAYGNDNIFSTKYPTTNAARIADMEDHTIKGNAGNRAVYIKDSAYNSLWVASDVAAFKTAMSGVYLAYEKATETTETADPYPETQIVGKGGTEEWIDNRAVPVPVGHRTQYYIGVPDVPANASAATLKATVSGGKTMLSWS